MGKLYDLVEFRNHLKNQLDDLCVAKFIEGSIDRLQNSKNLFPEHTPYYDIKINDYRFLKQKNHEIIEEFRSKISLLEIEIDQLADMTYNTEEYHNLFDEVCTQEPFGRKLIMSTELENIIESRVGRYCSCCYPALYINPRTKKWIDCMVAADPLYITHSMIHIVKGMIASYNVMYQNRLRLYEIIDRDFKILPQGQFSFVFCWDYLNYLSLKKVEKYIREVWCLLRPGGSFIFSYSNCDMLGTSLQIENKHCAYANSRWLKKLCNEIGYEVSELHDIETGDALRTHVSWAEIKKPGTLQSIRKQQALGTVKHKDLSNHLQDLNKSRIINYQSREQKTP